MKMRVLSLVLLGSTIAILCFWAPNQSSPLGETGGQSRKTAPQSAARSISGYPTLFVSNPATAAPWAIPFGKEFWRPNRALPMTSKTAIAKSGLVQRMRHTFQQDAVTGRATAAGNGYRIGMDGAGFVFTAVAGDQSFHLATQRIRIGQTELQGEIGAWQILGNTAQRDRFGDQSVIEHVEAEKHGASITWVLPAAPKSAGDAEIQVAVTGGGVVEQPGTIRTSAGPSARWGKAVAVDATGRRTNLSSRFSGDRITIEIPGELLASSQYPLAIDPTVTPLGGFGYEPTFFAPGPGPGTSNGTIWVGTIGDTEQPGVSGVARTNTTGKIVTDPIESPDLPIAAVAYSGGKYLCVGKKEDNTLGGQIMEIVDGQFVFGTPFQISTGEVGEIHLAASSGTFMAAWDDSDEVNPLIVRYAFISESGTVSSIKTLPISAGAEGSRLRGLAASPEGSWLAVVKENYPAAVDSQYWTKFVTEAGVGSEVLLGTEGVWGEQTFQVAFGPDKWLATWLDEDSNRVGRIFSDLGVVESPSPFILHSGSFLNGLAGTAAGWLSVFVEDDELHTCVTTTLSAGTAFPTGISSEGLNETPFGITKATETTALLVYHDEYSDDGVVNRGLILNPTTGAVVSGPFAYYDWLNGQENIAVASTGATVLAVWQDRMINGVVRGMRIDAEGNFLDSSALNFSNNATGDDTGSPAVAALNNRFLVAFPYTASDGTELVKGRCCDASTGLVGASPFAIDGGGTLGVGPEVAVASSTTAFLVVSQAINAAAEELKGTLVDSTGTPGTSSVLLSIPDASGDSVENPTLASDGSNWLLGYSLTHSGDTSFLVRTVPPALLAGSAVTIAADAPGAELSGFDIAFSGTQYLAVWGETPSTVRARLVSSSGALSAPVLVYDQGISPAVYSGSPGWLVTADNESDGFHLFRVNDLGVPESGDGYVATDAEVAFAPYSAAGKYLLGRIDYGSDEVESYAAASLLEYTEPLLTSAGAVTGRVGSAFNYTLTATNSPTSFSITGTLPAGLSFSGNSIAGVPTAIGSSTVTLMATNANGSGQQDLQISIAPIPPADVTPPTIGARKKITSKSKSVTVRINTGDADLLFYRITAPGAKPGKFKAMSVSGVAKLKVNTPEPGKYIVQYKAADAAGNMSATQKVTVKKKE